VAAIKTKEEPAGAQLLPDPQDVAERRLGKRLVLPGQILLLLLVLFPVVMEVYISLTDWTPASGNQWYLAYLDWTWFSNYWESLTSAQFLTTILRTIIITVAAVSIEFFLGFWLAVLYAERFPLKRVLTVFMLIPMMVVPAVSGFVFFLLLQSEGPVNALLSFVWPGDVAIPWLSSPVWAPISVIIVDVWQWTPLMFLILLSGILAVPEDQMNAAGILGASWSRRLRTLVIPMMKPIILIALIIRAMEAFKLFDAAWLLTQGGPGEASTTISVMLYRDAFLGSQWSLVAAQAIIIMVAISIVASRAIRPLEAGQAGKS
jgi:multiple sugar transport system permease protein